MRLQHVHKLSDELVSIKRCQIMLTMVLHRNIHTVSDAMYLHHITYIMLLGIADTTNHNIF